MVDEAKFQRFDNGKIRWSLLPLDVMRDIVGVLEFGAKKYAPNNWKKAVSEEDQERCWNSFYRHRDAFLIDNELCDAETKLLHTSHMLCNLMFIHWHLKEKIKNDKGKTKDSFSETGPVD